MASSSSTSSLRNLDSASNKLKDLFDKLSAGKRITKASDDAAGLAIAAALGADAAVFSQASRNADYGNLVLDTAEGALRSIGDISTRISELAAQSANGVYSDQQRQAIQQEFSSLREEANRIVQTTSFNGINPLQDQGITTQVGDDSSSSSQISVPGTNAATLISSLDSVDISTQAGAQQALDVANTLISNVSSVSGQIGATSSRLTYAKNIAEDRVEKSLQAKSRIEDQDFASGAADLEKARNQQKAAVLASQKEQESKRNILRFFA